MCVDLSQAHTLVDTQKFLLRQRRNRVWGCAGVATGGRTTEQFQSEWARIMHSFESDDHFSMEDSFDTSMPSAQTEGDRTKALIKQCLQVHHASRLRSPVCSKCDILQVMDRHPYMYVLCKFHIGRCMRL